MWMRSYNNSSCMQWGYRYWGSYPHRELYEKSYVGWGENPEFMNESSESNGWICKMTKFKEDEIQGLMNEEEYLDFIG